MSKTTAITESECNKVYTVDTQLPQMMDIARKHAVQALHEVKDEYGVISSTAKEIAGWTMLLAGINLLVSARDGMLEPLCVHFTNIMRRNTDVALPTQTVFLALKDDVEGSENRQAEIDQYVSCVENAATTTPKRTGRTKPKSKPIKTITPSSKSSHAGRRSLQEQLDSQLDPELQEVIRESQTRSVPTEATQPTIKTPPNAMPVIDPIATIREAKKEEISNE